MSCRPTSARSLVSRFMRRTTPSVHSDWPCGRSATAVPSVTVFAASIEATSRKPVCETSFTSQGPPGAANAASRRRACSALRASSLRSRPKTARSIVPP